MSLPDILDTQAIKAYITDHEAKFNSEFFDTKIEHLQNQRAQLFNELLIALWQKFELHQWPTLAV